MEHKVLAPLAHSQGGRKVQKALPARMEHKVLLAPLVLTAKSEHKVLPKPRWC